MDIKNEAIILSNDPFEIEITLNGKPKTINNLLGRNYWAKHNHARYWKGLISEVTFNKKPAKPLEKFDVFCVRYANRMLDFDGLVISFKPIIDGLKEAKIIKDDAYKHTGPWGVFQFFKSKKDGQYIKIKIKERL